MCGICGTLSLAGSPVAEDGVRGMLGAMVHRGPDGGGLYAEPGIVAGARRLAVIDVAGGDQPIASEDGRVQVVFNGEIYNHRDLRAELEGRGHRFRTRADTEVLVHLWEEYGAALLDRLRGMFAFCLHDAARRETLIARDRLGIKPLVYRVDGDRLAFASEVAVLLSDPAVPADVDHGRLIDQFRMQFVPGDGSVWRGVRSLPPGSMLRVRDGRLGVERWWSIPEPDAAAAPADAAGVERLAATLREMLDAAVRERLLADVPLGVFLSGGVDSATVLGLAAAASDRPVKTYSVGFAEPSYDERRWARLLAERFGADHHELVVGADELAGDLPAMIDHVAAPVTDPALLPTWRLARFARREVTVALTGEGADELFAGYRRYTWQQRYAALGRMPGLGALARGPLQGLLPGRVAQALGALRERDPAANHVEWAAAVGEAAAERLFEPAPFDGHRRRLHDVYADGFGEGRPARLADHLRADQRQWLPNDLLAKVDLATMAASLEARVPFLDHRIVEWAAGLPDEARLLGGESKRVLRRAVADLVPREILERPKRGFDLPLDGWLRGPLRETARELIEGPAIERWEGARPAAFRAMLRAQLDGRRGLALPLFNAVSIAMFLDRRGAR